jgi:hypothetical protein
MWCSSTGGPTPVGAVGRGFSLNQPPHCSPWGMPISLIQNTFPIIQTISSLLSTKAAFHFLQKFPNFARW